MGEITREEFEQYKQDQIATFDHVRQEVFDLVEWLRKTTEGMGKRQLEAAEASAVALKEIAETLKSWKKE